MKGMLVPIVIETLPGTASTVAQRLISIEGLSLLEGSSGSRPDGTWRALDGGTLEAVLRALALEPDIVGVFPGVGTRWR